MVFINTCLNCQLIHILGNLARGRGEETHSQMVGWGAWAQTEGALPRHLQVISKPTRSRMMTQQKIPTGLCSTPPSSTCHLQVTKHRHGQKVEKAAESTANLEKGN